MPQLPNADPRSLSPRAALAVLLVASLPIGATARAQSISPPFDTDYTLVDLGTPSGLFPTYGGVAFLRGAPDTLLMGAGANGPSGRIYEIPLTRDATGHLSGFASAGIDRAEAAYIDAGVTYAPDDVLFYTRYPNAELGEIKAGSSVTDKVVDLTALGFSGSPGGAQFVPAGFPGAGSLKITTYAASEWYSASVARDGSGTFDLTEVHYVTTLVGGLEGIAFVPAGSPQFPDYSCVLVAEYKNTSIAVYDLDAQGDPDPNTRRVLATGIARTEGLAFDPVSGDLVVSNFRTGHCYAIQGFAPPCEQDATWTNYGSGWPGTLGVPSFTSSADPVLGTTISVHCANSRGQSTPGLLLIGFESLSVQTNKGGTLLVLPFWTVPVVVPHPELVLTTDLPDDPTLCSLPLYAQVLQQDPGASHGLSFTEGLGLVLGL